MRNFILVGVLIVLGCGQKTPELTVEKFPELPVFRSIPVNEPGIVEVAKPIDFDLAGTWSVSRFGTKHQPQKGDRWEGTWKIGKRTSQRLRIWPEDDCKGHGCEAYKLLTVPVGDGSLRSGEVLVWLRVGERRYFSINEQRFGFLQMTGDDGDGYIAVRTEGDEPPAKLTCHISDWSMTEDGDLFQATLLTSDNTTHKAIWFKVGKKLVFAQWFTNGKEAQKIRGDKLQEAWDARTPGVYKMKPPHPAFVDDLKTFGKEVELK